MSLRERFVLQALSPGANVAETCRTFGISRKTGYKWLKRYREDGYAGLADQSRRPHCSPLRASGEAVLRVLELRDEHPRWGPKKLHAVLARSLKVEELPSVRTIARVLERAGAIRQRRRVRVLDVPSDRTEDKVEAPNDLWTVDFKGWWRTRDGSRAEPLTVRDAFSRYVLGSELVGSTDVASARKAFEDLFEHFGLPMAIRVDNGSPFISVRSPGGLTRLSAWWVSIGIQVRRGRPAHPEDNGAHERMHLDIARELEDVAADDLVQQQAALTRWRIEFNEVRPHEALGMRTPSEVYRRSQRRLGPPRVACYPEDFVVRTVNRRGAIKFQGHERYVSLALIGFDIGVQAVEDGSMRLRFYDMDLGTMGPVA